MQMNSKRKHRGNRSGQPPSRSGFRARPYWRKDKPPGAVFLPDGKLKLPTGFRNWIFVGGPLTPNGLNGGQANFPEFHNVYVEARNLEAYKKTGKFPEGTLLPTVSSPCDDEIILKKA